MARPTAIVGKADTANAPQRKKKLRKADAEMIAPQRKHPSSRPAPAPIPGPPPRSTAIPALQRLLHLHTSPPHLNHHHHIAARPCLRGTPPRHATAVPPRRPRPTHASPARLRRSPLSHAPDTRPCRTGPPYPSAAHTHPLRHCRSPPPLSSAASRRRTPLPHAPSTRTRCTPDDMLARPMYAPPAARYRPAPRG